MKFTIQTFMVFGKYKYKSNDISNCKSKITLSGKTEQLFLDALDKGRLTATNPDDATT